MSAERAVGMAPLLVPVRGVAAAMRQAIGDVGGFGGVENRELRTILVERAVRELVEEMGGRPPVPGGDEIGAPSSSAIE